MKTHNAHSPLQQAGFSLVEIMVGMTIGLLATLVIMQLMASFEVQKQTTSASADTQTNGAVALFHIDRDLKNAGYPLTATTNSPLACATLAGVLPLNTLSPVIITDNDPGSDAGSDAIIIHYGDSPNGGIPASITGPAPYVNSQVLAANSNLGCNAGDQAIIINNANCTMTTAAPVSSINNTQLQLADVTNVVQNKAEVACLGNWNTITYRVVNGDLVKSIVSSNPQFNQAANPIVANIVSIQAQYGIANPNEAQSVKPVPPNPGPSKANNIVQWVDATGPLWANPTVANRNLIKAVRIAFVARNPAKEATVVTTPCATNPNGLCAWDNDALNPAPPNINLNADPDWQRYRYRIYETIIPLRNVIWSWGIL